MTGLGNTSQDPTIGAMILMAGQSTRMPDSNKLLLTLPNGRSIAQQTIQNIQAAGYHPIVVVLGHEAAQVQQQLQHTGVQFVLNPDYPEGMGTSVASGVTELMKPIQTGCDAVLVALGDMPFVTSDTLRRLRQRSMEVPQAIIAPTMNGRRGNPVIFPARFFPQLQGCTGDVGGKEILRRHIDDVVLVEVSSTEVIQDIDTLSEFHRYKDGVS